MGRRYLETQAEPGHSVWFSAFYIIGAQADGTLTEGWFCGPSGIPREKYNKTLNTRTHVTHPRVHTHAHTWDTHVCAHARMWPTHVCAHTRTHAHVSHTPPGARVVKIIRVVEDISLVIQKSHRSGGDPPKTIQNPPHYDPGD